MPAHCPDIVEKTNLPLRIAVTGGSGRIGQQVLIGLTARGHSAINLDRRTFKDQPGRFAFVDLRDRGQVQPWLEQADAVVHLGEIPNAGAPFSPDVIYGNNCHVGALVMQAAADLKLRHVVYSSSCQVYGSLGQHQVPPLCIPVDESHPLRPRNVYSLSKAANEGYAQQLARDTGMSISIFRLPWVMNYDYSQADFDAFEKREDDAPVHDLATYVYHGDVSHACALAIEQALPGCEAYNIAAEDIVSHRPLADRLRRHHPDFPALPPGWGDFQSPLATQKARQKLGWRPRWSLHEQARLRRQEAAAP